MVEKKVRIVIIVLFFHLIIFPIIFELYADNNNIAEKEEKCFVNNFSACAELGGLYYKGESVKKDYRKSLIYFTRGCNGKNAISCSVLGYIYETGKGVEANKKMAGSFYKKACSLGEFFACEKIKLLYDSNLITNEEKLKIRKRKKIEKIYNKQNIRFYNRHHIDLNASFPSVVFYSGSLFENFLDFSDPDDNLVAVYKFGYAFSFTFDTNSIHVADWLYILSGFSARTNLLFSDFNINEDNEISFYKANLIQGFKINPVKWFYMTLYWNPYVSIANKAFDPKGAGINLGFVVGGPFLIGVKAYFFHDNNIRLYTSGIDLNIGWSFLID